jgi:putative transcriptional regulator
MLQKTLGYITGQLLIATPQMDDPRFKKSLIYVCGHDKNGAMGIIINRPMPSPTFPELLFQLGIETLPQYPNTKIYFGGPVEGGRGFVLHSPDYDHEATVQITNNISLTATIDVVRAIAIGKGPTNAIMALGYAGWQAGQLDDELRSNAWLVAPGDTELLFDSDADRKWDQAMASIGISNAALLISEIGHA